MYIEREALTALAYKSGDYGHPAVVDLEDIADIPAADVVEVVRCKECKYWGGHDGSGNSCTREFDWYGVSPDDFCSLGERRSP